MTSRGARYWDNGAIPLIAPDVLGGIISEVSDLGIVMTENAEVLSVLVNPNMGSYKGLETIEGQTFQSSLTIESVEKFDNRLAEFLASDAPVRPVELNHTDKTRRWEYPLRYSFHRIGPDGAILLLGRDLRPIAEMQQQLVKAQLALERDYEAQREFDTRFRVLMDSTSDAIVFVSAQTGRVTEVNASAAKLLGEPTEDVKGRQFSELFEGKNSGALIDQLSTRSIAGADAHTSLKLRGKAAQVQLSSRLFRAAGERFILCRIQGDDVANKSVSLADAKMDQLFTASPDAIVFAKTDGAILSANDSFLDLLGVASDAVVRGRNLADYLLRGTVDMKVMAENTGRTGRMRRYATKVAGDYGSPRNVEMSVTKIDAGQDSVFAYIIRDASRVETALPESTGPQENINSVVELVGSATLKDIVAETTNAVEKMCIETAVELTMNNRVAAAEMLGLSRQSLYVKLRKFDLLSR